MRVRMICWRRRSARSVMGLPQIGKRAIESSMLRIAQSVNHEIGCLVILHVLHIRLVVRADDRVAAIAFVHVGVLLWAVAPSQRESVRRGAQPLLERHRILTITRRLCCTAYPSSAIDAIVNAAAILGCV